MSKEKQIEIIIDLLTEFDEMGFQPTILLPNNPEAYAKEWKEKLIKALQGYRKQSEGEWKKTTEPLGAHEVDCVECSVCGESWVLDEDFDYDVVKDFWSFCPNCGAKMKGGE